jgi:hypothetical protein
VGTEVPWGDGGSLGGRRFPGGTEVALDRVLRSLALAFVLGTMLVLAIAALLHLALSAIRGDAMAAPWWVNARVLERSVWVIAALLAWWVAPWLGSSELALKPASPALSADDASKPLSRQAANRFVGVAMIVVPVLWFFATLIAFAVHVTLRGEWRSEGARLLGPYLYSEAVLTNAPWLLAGATLVVLARHLSGD